MLLLVFILRFLLCGGPPVWFRAAPQTRGTGLLLQGQHAKPWSGAGLLCQQFPLGLSLPHGARHTCMCSPVLLPFNCSFCLCLLGFFLIAHRLKPPLISLSSDCHWVSVTLWSPTSNVLENSAVCFLLCFPAHTRLIQSVRAGKMQSKSNILGGAFGQASSHKTSTEICFIPHCLWRLQSILVR